MTCYVAIFPDIGQTIEGCHATDGPQDCEQNCPDPSSVLYGTVNFADDCKSGNFTVGAAFFVWVSSSSSSALTVGLLAVVLALLPLMM